MAHTLVIIQARSGSSRLPQKVLMDIAGETMLARVVNRVRRAAAPDDVVVATTDQLQDQSVVEECHRLDIPVVRGSEQDVLDRFYHTATAFNARVIIRITADCPLIDFSEVDRVARQFFARQPDYASNVLVRTLPRGLDTEVMTMAALTTAWSEAAEPYQRVHVTPYLYQNPDRFRLLSVTTDNRFGDYRWTVDTLQDLEFVRQVYARFGNRDDFGWRDVIALLEREPELAGINSTIEQKPLTEG